MQFHFNSMYLHTIFNSSNSSKGQSRSAEGKVDERT